MIDCVSMQNDSNDSNDSNDLNDPNDPNDLNNLNDIIADSDMRKYNQILQNVVFHWSTISKNEKIMNVLTDSNKMCSILRESNKFEDDSMIQARALSFLLFMIV